jgi:O-acetyl-ADP-ribose deacetylase (regulator of RNase III)
MNTVLKERKLPTGQTLQIVQGDITTEKVDAIVNAANEHLQHGGGVAWAISKRGGPTIQQESDEWIRTNGTVSHAHPAWTSGGQLPARFVIHAVGPVWGHPYKAGAGGDEDAKLSEAVIGSLQVAEDLGLESIALPAISTGIFGFPKDRAAKIMLNSIAEYFSKEEPSSLKTVRLVLFDNATVEEFLKAWRMENVS